MIHDKNFPFHEPEDETEIIHVDHGHHSRAGKIGKIFVIAVIAVMLFLSAKALFDIGRGVSFDSGTPVIEPNPEPYKSAPEDPGGMQIPHIDKEIYGKLKMPIEEPIDLYAEEHFKNGPIAKIFENEKKATEEENQKLLGSSVNKPEVVRPDDKPTPKTIKIDSAGRGVEVSKPSQAKVIEVESGNKARRIDVEKVLAKNADGNEIWLQLGSFKSEDEATRAWQDTREKNGDILKDLTIKVTKSDMKDQGVIYRLQAGSVEDEQKAKEICVKLNARKQSCFHTTYKSN